MADFISDEEMNAFEAKYRKPSKTDFISDEEMMALDAKNEPKDKSKGFSDALSEMSQGPSSGQTGYLERGLLEALPIAGSIAGGLIGSGFGPFGTIGGAGLGAAAGKSLEQAGKELFFDEGPKERKDVYLEPLKEGIYGSLGEIGGQALGKGLSLASEKISKSLPKIGHALTGVPEQEIKTYAKNANVIKKMAKESDSSTFEAADQIRKQFNDDIYKKTSLINNEISSVLENSQKKIHADPIIESLEKYKTKINPKLYPEQVGQIDDIIKSVNSLVVDGNISAKEAHQVKTFLQDKASSAYRNGDMFQVGTETANAAKSGAKTARILLNEAEPAVAEANNRLAHLHEIEDSMNSNLLKVGSPEAALMAAGSGGNMRNQKALEQLGDFTGTPMLEQAQNLAAMRTFNNAPIMPVDTTGKSAARMGASTALGFLGGGPVGAAIGGALSSPLALKGAMDVSRKVSPLIEKAIPSMGTIEQSGKGVIQKYLQEKYDKKETNKPPDQTSILEKVKGSPYEQVLQNALKNGGDKSFAAANYVLKNRDQNYRKIFEKA